MFTFPLTSSTESINNNFGERRSFDQWQGVRGRQLERHSGRSSADPEAGIGGVPVTLKDASGATIDTQTTAPDGSYNFGPRHSGPVHGRRDSASGYGSSTPDSVPINLAVVGQHVVNFGDTPCGVAYWNTGESGGLPAARGR